MSWLRPAAGVAAIAALACVALSPAVARAGDAETAASLAAEGRRLGDQKRFAEALVKFRAAYALDPRTDYLCNIGFAQYSLDALPAAFAYLSLCDAAATSKPKGLANVLGYVRTKLDAGGSYARVTVTVEPADVAARVSSPAVDAGAALPAPHTVYVPLGTEIVWTARADGRPDGQRSQTFDRAGEHAVTITLPPPAETGTASKPPPVTEPVPDRGGDTGTIEPVPPAGGDVARTAPPRKRTWAWVAAGGAVAAAGFGVFAYTRAADPIDDIDNHFVHDPPDRDELIDRFHLWYGVQWASFGVAAAAAGVSTWLFLRDDGGEQPAAISAAPSADGRGGMVWMTWTR